MPLEQCYAVCRCDHEGCKETFLAPIYIGTRTGGSGYMTYEEVDIEIEQVAEKWNHQVTAKDKDIFFCPTHNINNNK